MMIPGSPELDRPRKVLLVEDDEMTRSFIQRFLEREGYAVTAVDAAEEGIVEAGDSPPDVLLTDIHLPGLDGIELASFLLAQDPALPVILMTGDPDEGLARRAMACGPVQYLLKPFEWFEMEAAVRFALSQRDTAVLTPADTVLELTEIAAESDPDAFGITGGWDAPDGLAGCAGEAAPSVTIDVTDPLPAPARDEAADPHPLPASDVAAGSHSTQAFHEAADAYPGLEADRAAEPTVAAVEEVAEAWLREVDRDSWAGPGHGDRVAKLAVVLLAEMADAAVEAHELALACRVHEVGRLQLPDADPVSAATRGAEVLEEAGFPAPVVEAVRHAHERWDGTAGPARLSGARIPAAAQILAVADALDHYVSAWLQSGIEPGESVERALRQVTVQQNLAFGPAVVGAMHRAADPVRELGTAERPDTKSSVSIPAMAAAESVPFALFATG